MSYSYMKHHYGDNCFYGDTSYKRYARYHMPRASVNIFNVGGGGCYNTHHCCGGGWLSGGNFWSGLGLGLGAGLGNMLMGGLNMLGGWLGGGGLGFPSFGFGNYGGGYMTPFGLGTSASDGSHRRIARKEDSDLKPQKLNNGKKKDETDNTDRAQIPKDVDYDKINDLVDTSKLPNLVSSNEESVKAYNAKIDEAIKALDEYVLEDDIDTDANKEHISDMKDLLLKSKVTYVDPAKNMEDGITIILDGKNITNIDHLLSLPFDVIKNINEDDAKTILTHLNVIDKDAGLTEDHTNGDKDLAATGTTSYLCGKLVKLHPNILKLLEIADITTEVYKGNSLNKDRGFTGKIQSVTPYKNDGIESFVLSCEETGEDGFKGIYTIKRNNDGKYSAYDKNNNLVGNNLIWDEDSKLLTGGSWFVSSKK